MHLVGFSWPPCCSVSKPCLALLFWARAFGVFTFGGKEIYVVVSRDEVSFDVAGNLLVPINGYYALGSKIFMHR
jgi:hypothetical protein